MAVLLGVVGVGAAHAKVEKTAGAHWVTGPGSELPLETDEPSADDVVLDVELPPGQWMPVMPRPISSPREYVDRFPLTPSEPVAKHELLRATGDPRSRAYDALSRRWGLG